MNKGYTQVYTGNGKGKTTAALGLALRAAGAGLYVWIGQFVKGQHCSEHNALKRFEDYVEIHQFGSGEFIVSAPSDQDCINALHGLEQAKKAMLGGSFQVVILDEVCLAVSIKVCSVDNVLDLVHLKPNGVELVLTGRDAPLQLIEAADIVTEMREIKHYFKKGVTARKGIEM